MKELEAIRLRGVRQNNLQGIDVAIPLGKLVVVTGLSGTGKSSLVFDTLHAEGQRRYVETFSPYTRQFLDLLGRPHLDAAENVRPSIAIQQGNTVKTSRSTVGTMTELCDYFKVWFSHAAALYDPDTGERVEDDNPQTIWRKASNLWPAATVIIAFPVVLTEKLPWADVLGPLKAQGYTRVIVNGRVRKLDDQEPPDSLLRFHVVQDRLRIAPPDQPRFVEAATVALRFGRGELAIFADNGTELARFSEGLHSPATGRRFRPATPGLFSFNSPLGACPRCRGFGRIIEIDWRLVVPDHSLSLRDGAIRPFQGEVYSESLRDLLRAAARHDIPVDVPWGNLSTAHKAFVMDGEPGYGTQGREYPNAWYGVRRFFDWLEGNTYKMHVRVFLSRYRSYVPCPSCDGNRLQPESLCWKWSGQTLPQLYRLPVGDLRALLRENARPPAGRSAPDLALDAILSRLDYLCAVGLEYLTLDRPSRTLSGGEAMRVNLTACLGTSLTDTLFVLDEPSVGLHSRDVDKLIALLKRLRDAGNTVVVVEHDETVMRAADHLLELGPEPGSGGGRIVFSGTPEAILDAPSSLTGRYLSGAEAVPVPRERRPCHTCFSRRRGRAVREQPVPCLHVRGAVKHNLRGLSVDIPLRRFVCLGGVSGSGKSTLLDHVLHQGLLAKAGRMSEDPATVESLDSEIPIDEVVLVDQSPVSRTPRSNPALYAEAWDAIRTLFGSCEAAQQAGLSTSHFSFNSGDGRCDHCQGLGFERIEMQFLSDVYVPCPVCEGRRFKPEILAIRWNNLSVADVLALDVASARQAFHEHPAIASRLAALEAVGLGYLTLGQPLNTLSGGESQRLKLVRYLGRIGGTAAPAHALLLLDEPTTGLHTDDVRRLVGVLQSLVERGHSLVVIEHNIHVLKSADWIIEIGPGAGDRGGQVVAEGTPEAVAKAATATAPFLREALAAAASPERAVPASPAPIPFPQPVPIALVAEPPVAFGETRAPDAPAPEASCTAPVATDDEARRAVEIVGAREHNLKDLNVSVPHRRFTVVTGVSGSGKSTLAFDIVFAEGQRRFMESMSSYARQFVEQMPRPEVDRLTGIPPTVAIEQRITRGSRKSTVATITEVAQYLRLLYARVGVQHSPRSGKPLESMSPGALRKRLDALLADAPSDAPVHLCAPIIRGRKGHHQPLADWAREHGYTWLRVDGSLVPVDGFKKLDRYREHDIEVVVATFNADTLPARKAGPALDEALRLGKGACFLAHARRGVIAWLSTSRTDPDTGESYPELDPKHFSWNSPKGWCPACRGFGRVVSTFREPDEANPLAEPDESELGARCPECGGARLNPVSRAVRITFADGSRLSLPEILASTPSGLLQRLTRLKLDARGKAIVKDMVPQIVERLAFMDKVGLGYLTLDRPTNTLSGGEAQRIRLAAQLGSNLSGVLYVLDEPSIGLHARDGARLIQSLKALREKGNTLLVVEHDEDTMRQADNIIDLGPGAGAHGGQLLAEGPIAQILNNPASPTGHSLRDGIPHPLRGHYRPLPQPWNPRRKGDPEWLVLRGASLRNLKGDDLHLPIGRLCAVCGISGAGKSTLIRDLLKPAAEYALRRKLPKLQGSELDTSPWADEPTDRPPLRDLLNAHLFKQVIEVDQEPIGKTPRSTPATYIGAFDLIRDLFASLPEARVRGYGPGTFSFNTAGGRCETCAGAGRVKLEMSFMPDTYVPCEDCGGCRYGPELSEIRLKGRNIAQVLGLTFEEAASVFDFHARLKDLLDLMCETGLGYLTLGQSSTTLSGGEAQRLKLVSELAKGLPGYKERARGTAPRNLYLLEEPTIGLHLSDCRKLIGLLHRLVDQGHTVVVIEHHLDVLAEADYLVEVGPEGGAAGGHILYQGETRGILACKQSPTAPFLAAKLPTPAPTPAKA